MLIELITGRVKKIGLAFAGIACLAAAPASANTNAAAAAVTKPLAEQSSNLSGGDEKFRQLFTSWEALDQNGPQAPIEQRPTVSVPSVMPVRMARLSSGYGMRNHPVLGRRRNHKGVDLAAPTGTPIFATADGMVGRANWFSSYGLYIRIDHGAGIETRYAHMSKLAVAAGERVRQGQVIGYVGSTGRSTGPHLHYEVRVNGVAVNPIPYMVKSKAQERFALTTGEGGRGGK